jgi:hypothetical protein
VPARVRDLIAAALVVIPAFVPFPGDEFRPEGPLAITDWMGTVSARMFLR